MRTQSFPLGCAQLSPPLVQDGEDKRMDPLSPEDGLCHLEDGPRIPGGRVGSQPPVTGGAESPSWPELGSRPTGDPPDPHGEDSAHGVANVARTLRPAPPHPWRLSPARELSEPPASPASKLTVMTDVAKLQTKQ